MEFALCSHCFEVGEERQLEDKAREGECLALHALKSQRGGCVWLHRYEYEPSADTGHTLQWTFTKCLLCVAHPHTCTPSSSLSHLIPFYSHNDYPNLTH